MVLGGLNLRFKEGQNFRFGEKKLMSETCDTKLQSHWEVALCMFYRLTDLYAKQISHVREIDLFGFSLKKRPHLDTRRSVNKE